MDILTTPQKTEVAAAFETALATSQGVDPTSATPEELFSFVEATRHWAHIKWVLGPAETSSSEERYALSWTRPSTSLTVEVLPYVGPEAFVGSVYGGWSVCVTLTVEDAENTATTEVYSPESLVAFVLSALPSRVRLFVKNR